MGFQDRHYQQINGGGGYRGGNLQTSGFGLPKPPQVVKYLLIINVVVFILQLLFRDEEKYGSPFAGSLEYYFSVSTIYKEHYFQFWRLITFQFLHSVHDAFHLLFNMIGLYFLGSMLERAWGGKRFLVFYLSCGFVGGAIYLAACMLGILHSGSLVGASGGVLGLLGACAILFPQVSVILFIFPVPIRTAASLLTIVYLLMVLTGGSNAGGHLCHLGGMATGAIWVLGRPYYAAQKAKYEQAAVRKDKQVGEKQQYEVDRILAKVHEKGVHSLTSREKRTLQQATDQEKQKSRR